MVLRRGLRAVLLLCLIAPVLPAEQDRIATAIDPHNSVVLRGSVPLQAHPKYDQGAVAADFRLGNITLMLRPSAAQQAALEALLAQQQDPASPNYHNWLTPEEYAERFGASRADFEKLSGWLRSQGFEVRYSARGRDFISFAGTAGQVQTALHTQIHRYRIGTETHFANSNEISLPAAVAPLVAGILGLHDFHPRAPRRHVLPGYNGTDGSHYLAPDDFATIYNLNPLYRYGYTGVGQSIVIVGQSDFNPDDIAAFRKLWNLAPSTVRLVPTGDYPGITGDANEIEADLDLEWAGAIARDANLIFVVSEDADYSAYYAIDNHLAPIISESFGLCEFDVGSHRMGLLTSQMEAQKGNALGITWLASSGDSGAAGCDYSALSASQGLGVSLPASVPEITAVGGTEFNEGDTSYWTSKAGPNGVTAMSYIPEKAWNDTSMGDGLASSGGGASSVFPKPTWQKGPGVPSDGVRDVPDVALAAANGHDPYIVISEGESFGVGGTSAAAPSFAGILAVLNQFLVQNQVQSKPGLGNLNIRLYSMAAVPNTAFHDITSGDNIVPCDDGSPNCIKGQLGYKAGPGYDLVTGLGSVDAYNLITSYAGIPVTATTMTLTANPSTILVSGATVLTATVKAVNGTLTPTGSVTFTVGNVNVGSVPLSGTGTTATATLSIFGGQLPAVSNTIQANYGGSPTFNPSSASATVSIGTPTVSSAVTLTVNPNPVFQQAPDANGATFAFTITLTETAGVDTTLTGFTFNGQSYSTSIASFFGSTTLPGHGTSSASLKAAKISVPSSAVVAFTGRDGSGKTWSKQVTVSFQPAKTGTGNVTDVVNIAVGREMRTQTPILFPARQE